MANVKSRPKAHRSASTKSKVCKTKHASAGHKDAGRPDTKKSNNLRAVANDKMHVKFLSPNDFVKTKNLRSTKTENKTMKDVPNLSKEQSTSKHPTEFTDMKKLNNLKSVQSKEKVHKKKLLPTNNLSKNIISSNRSNTNNKVGKDSLKLHKGKCLNNSRKPDINNANNIKSVLMQKMVMHDMSSNDLDKHIIPNNRPSTNNKVGKDTKDKTTNHTKRLDISNSNNLKSALSQDMVTQDILSKDLGKHSVSSNRPKANKVSKDTLKELKDRSTNNSTKSDVNNTNNIKSMVSEKMVAHDTSLNDSGGDKLTNEKPQKVHSININTLITKSGRIKRKNKDHFKILDDILKSELMINDRKKKKNNETSSYGQNNNDIEITNQNASVNSTLTHSTQKQDSIQTGTENKQNKTEKNIPDNSNKKKVVLTSGRVMTLPVFECDYCGKSFTNKKSICRHIYVHLKIKPYRCKHCSHRFSHRANMELHVKKIHLEPFAVKSFVCQICKKSYTFKQKLLTHLELHIKTENHSKCYYCFQKFTDKTVLIQHEKDHMKLDYFKCSLCDLRFDSGKQLALHAKNHLQSKSYVCQYCGKEYSDISSLKRHLGVAHTGHRVQCPICNKNLKGHLSEHLRTHEKDRPHECPECGQRFTQSTQLNVHRRCHTGARPYPCKICKRCFTHSNALMLHTRRHTGEKPFPCAMCPLSFSQLPHMKAHMRNIHGKENAYRCQKCGQFYKFKAHLDNHVKACTVGDKELSFEEKIQASIEYDEIESVMDISRMRFLLALLLTMISSQDKLKYLGFNKRLIDDILVECIEAMGQTPCKDESLSPLRRLKTNIEMLLVATIPKEEMDKFQRQNKSTEELLEILTDAKKPCIKMKETI